MTFHERKEERRDYFMKYVYGWKQRPCSACNGSGRYDSDGSPACGGCDGTGKEKYKPEQVP
jgi:DnaJ-class molecular chaperone